MHWTPSVIMWTLFFVSHASWHVRRHVWASATTVGLHSWPKHMSVCFPCGPIQLSVAFVRPSVHVFVVLGIVVEIVSIFGDVGKSVTSCIHPIAHNMHSLCARVSLF